MLRSFFQSRWCTVLILAILVAAGFALVKRLPLMASLEAEIREVQTRSSALGQSQEDLAARQAFMASEAYKERQARLTLHYKKPGEQVVYVYYPAASSSPVPSPVPRASWWQNLVGKIMRD